MTETNVSRSQVSHISLLDEVIAFRDECRTAQRELIPQADPTGDARRAYGVCADQLTALLERQRFMTGSTFDRLRLHNPIVAQIMRAGGTAEDCAVALSVQNNRLVDRVTLLEGVVPRKIRLPDGRVMVWRCPDNLVPETDMSNA